MLCRMNVYWASQHYQDLTDIRQRQGLNAPAETPLFLLRAHERAMSERAERGGNVEHKVRQIARRAMRGEARDLASAPARTVGGAAPARNKRDGHPISNDASQPGEE